MLELYSWNTPNGRKITIAVEEMQIAYELIPIDISNNEQFDPAFLKISPNNKIPAIVDGNTSLMESGAILLYLADKSGKLAPATGSDDYWTMLQWLMWQVGGFGPMLGQAHHYLHFNRGKSAYSEERYLNEAKRLYSVLDLQLSRTHFVANELSIADIAIWTWASRFEYQKIDLDDYANVKRWYLELASRPAFQSGYALPDKTAQIPLP